MFKTLLLATAAALTATAAAAQPEGLVGTPATPWAGPYIGLHGGYAIDRDSPVTTGGLFAGNIANVANEARPNRLLRDKEGYVAGGQVGYNVQHGMIVAGVEADISVTDFSASQVYRSPRAFGAAPAGTASDVSSRTNYLGSVRGRVGLASDNLLIYGTGGYAYGSVKNRAVFRNGVNPNQIDFAAADDYSPDGWVAGAGVEYAVPVSFNPLSRFGSSRATIRGEYLHYDLQDRNLFVNAVSGAGSYVTRFKNDADVFRAGLNFKF